MNKALLDTDIYSEILKAVDPNVARNATAYRQAHGVLTLSSITVMELVRGFEKRQSRRKLQAFLTAIALEEVLDFTRSDERIREEFYEKDQSLLFAADFRPLRPIEEKDYQTRMRDTHIWFLFGVAIAAAVVTTLFIGLA